MLIKIVLALLFAGILGAGAASSKQNAVADDPIPLCTPDAPNCGLGGPK